MGNRMTDPVLPDPNPDSVQQIARRLLRVIETILEDCGTIQALIPRFGRRTPRSIEALLPGLAKVIALARKSLPWAIRVLEEYDRELGDRRRFGARVIDGGEA